MTDLVVDASVVLKWFRADGEAHVAEARALRAAFSAGRLFVHAPPLLKLEIVNIAARRWGWDEARLIELTESLEELGIAFSEPELLRVARWAGRGITAYDAAYVALAEAGSSRFVTDDARVIAAAPAVAIALSAADRWLEGSATEDTDGHQRPA